MSTTNDDTADVTPAEPEMGTMAALLPGAPETEAEKEPPKPRESDGCFLAVGRRKTAVARVRVRPGGEGKFVVNGRELDEFFSNPQDRRVATTPLDKFDRRKSYDVFARVHGGGNTGQSGALLMALARVLIQVEPGLEAGLRSEGYLTRDARMKERKKYGRRGARRGFQFSKR